uniref:uncharacterized protein LOC120340847 n=1 Tax=Styela clava TaxID=7725 RepID=UPI001939BB32|nr:uncharacterized protein LOC120340847 [Styela clava]
MGNCYSKMPTKELKDKIRARRSIFEDKRRPTRLIKKAIKNIVRYIKKKRRNSKDLMNRFVTRATEIGRLTRKQLKKTFCCCLYWEICDIEYYEDFDDLFDPPTPSCLRDKFYDLFNVPGPSCHDGDWQYVTLFTPGICPNPLSADDDEIISRHPSPRPFGAYVEQKELLDWFEKIEHQASVKEIEWEIKWKLPFYGPEDSYVHTYRVEEKQGDKEREQVFEI